MAETGARGSYAKGRARREEIRRTAMEVFATEGYRGGSLVTIARRVGLSEAGLLHHFRSKEDLLLAVLELRDQADADMRAGVEAGELSWLDSMVIVGRRIVDQPELVRLFCTLAAESLNVRHPAHLWFRSRARRVRQDVTDVLVAGQQRGEIPADVNPRLIATHLVAVFDGLQLQWLLDPDEVDLVTALGDYLALLADRLGLPAPDPSAGAAGGATDVETAGAGG